MATYPRGAGYETKFMVSGQRYWNTHKTQAEGEAWELEQRSRLKRGLPVVGAVEDATSSKTGKIQTIEDLVAHVDKVRWSRNKSGDYQHRNADLFAKWCGPKLSPSQALTTAKIEEYTVYRRTEKRNKDETINRHLSAISCLHSAATALKLPNVGDLKLPWKKEGGGRRRFYSPEEETLILGSLVQWGYSEYVDLFTFLIDTGARLEEAETFGRIDRRNGKRPAKLQWSDIRGNAITFEDTKTGLPRTVYGTPRVMAALKRMKARSDTPHGPFQWLVRRHLRKVWNELRAAHPWMGADTVVHTFRHTCASRLVQSGVDLYRVMKWMGHKDFATTQRYAKLRPIDMEALSGVLADYKEKDQCQEPSSAQSSRPSSSASGLPPGGDPASWASGQSGRSYSRDTSPSQ